MSLWTPLQRDCLEAMGFELMALRGTAATLDGASAPATPVALGETGGGIPPAAAPRAPSDPLLRAARGVDLAALLADTGRPADVASRRAFWRQLRPLRKAMRGA